MHFHLFSHPNTKKATYLMDYPTDCPTCHQKTTPNFNSVFSSRDSKKLSVFLNCPNPNCEAGYVADYVPNSGSGSHFSFESIYRGSPKEFNFSSEIINLSPTFCKIYNEAYFAEQNNLLEICGVGFRKALEFLIKDYLILKNPDKESDIKKALLGKCISEYVEDNRIKESAKRATWLGNDQTHYVKKWIEKDLHDLKLLLKLTVNWIESELMTEQFINDMV